MAILQVAGVRKTYGTVEALKGVSFEVAQGEIVGLLGPNGAGKTTTLSSILGILEPSEGSITIDGIDLARQRSAALERTNFAAVYAAMPGNLTVEQNLRIFAYLYGVGRVEERLEALMREFDLVRLRHAKCGVLSSGESTRVGIAKALLNAPRLLLLDEPTASLDPSTARVVREQIRAYARAGQGGVLWTSHNMHEVAEVCDRVLFLSHGEILLAGDPKALPQEHGKENLEELFIAIAREPLSLAQEHHHA